MKKFLLAAGVVALGAAGLQVLAQGPTTVTFWSTENQPERLARTREIIAAFEKANPSIKVQLVGVEEKDLPARITAAFAAKQLPDVVFHGLDYTVGWAKQGVLNTTASDELVRELGVDTFSRGPVRLATVDGKIAAVPSDGWAQLMLYRKDLFAAKGLKAPTNWDNIRAAAKALNDPPNQYGFVNATDPSQPYFQQVFEYFAMSNGVKLTDKNGKVTLNTNAMRQTLQFYKELTSYSPPGNLYWQQSRELYFAGKAAMITWSPFILDELAGLRNNVPVLIDREKGAGWLAKNTGFVNLIQGPQGLEGASYGQVQYLGITRDANVAQAKQFVKYWMSDGYLSWLGIAAEGKFPLRNGSKPGSKDFVDGWAKIPVGVDTKAPLSQFYPRSVIDGVINGLNDLNRWGFAEGQGVLVGKLYGTLTLPQIVRKYLDGAIDLEATVTQLQTGITALK
jgi:multiple sugar transport system substrate-binding protein